MVPVRLTTTVETPSPHATHPSRYIRLLAHVFRAPATHVMRRQAVSHVFPDQTPDYVRARQHRYLGLAVGAGVKGPAGTRGGAGLPGDTPVAIDRSALGAVAITS